MIALAILWAEWIVFLYKNYFFAWIMPQYSLFNLIKSPNLWIQNHHIEQTKLCCPRKPTLDVKWVKSKLDSVKPLILWYSFFFLLLSHLFSNCWWHYSDKYIQELLHKKTVIQQLWLCWSCISEFRFGFIQETTILTPKYS